MDTLIHIEGFNPAIKPWGETEIASGRCIVSFSWMDNISEQNTREITITFTRSESRLVHDRVHDRLVSCIKSSDGHLIVNSDILKICMAISPVTKDQETNLKMKWRGRKHDKSNPDDPNAIRPDNPLYRRLETYKFPETGPPRRSVFKCSDWSEDTIKDSLFTWLALVEDHVIPQSDAQGSAIAQQSPIGLPSNTVGEKLSGDGQAETQRRDVRSIWALLNAGPQP